MNLRPFTPNDLELIKHWFHEKHVRRFFGEPKDWLAEVEENMGHSDWIYYHIFETDRPIGFTQYYDAEKAPEGVWSGEPKGTVGIDYLVGDHDSLNKGYGTRIIALLLKVIKARGDFHCIIADPDPENIASTKVLEKNGFLPRPGGLYKLYLP